MLVVMGNELATCSEPVTWYIVAALLSTMQYQNAFYIVNRVYFATWVWKNDNFYNKNILVFLSEILSPPPPTPEHCWMYEIAFVSM